MTHLDSQVLNDFQTITLRVVIFHLTLRWLELLIDSLFQILDNLFWLLSESMTVLIN